MRPKYPARRGGAAGTAKKAALILIPGVAGLVLLCAVGLGILLGVLKPADYRQLMADAVEKATGLHPEFHGEAETTFFPSLGLKTGKVTLSNPQTSVDPELLTAESASAALSLSSLLRGDVAVEEILLSGLKVTLTVDPAGRSNWSPAKERRGSDDGPAAEPVAPPPDAAAGKKFGGPPPDWSLNRLSCKDIRLAYRDLRNGDAYSAEIDTLALNGLKEGAGAPLTLAGRARDEAGGITLSFRLQAVLELRAPDARDKAAEPSLYLDVAKLELEPKLGNLPPITAELGGKTEISASGAWQAKGIKGMFTLPGAAPAHFTASAACAPGSGAKRKLEGELALDSLDINAALRLRAPAVGEAAPGTVQGAPNLGKPTVAGPKTPASDARAGRDKQGKPGADGAAEKKPAKASVPPGLLNLETTFTVTADKALYGKITLSNIRGDLKMQGGKADLAYSLTLFKGQLAGKAALDLRGAEPALAVNAALRSPDMELAAASPVFSDHYTLSGTLRASLDLKCKGGTVDAMLHSLNGKASAAARDGEVGGFTLAPELPGFAPFPSAFAYKSISASAVVTQGEAVSKDIAVVSNAILARGGGTVHIAYGQADLGIDFMTAGPPPGPAVPVSIRGPLHALSYSIDTRTLLRNAAENAARAPEAATDLLKKSGEAVKGLKDSLIPRR
ncbi:MAG: AsmA family protein [Desulfovibrio sp.]|jgi:AsmA protein|nr:AsmA family protein [Desulfovibrio sp.]